MKNQHEHLIMLEERCRKMVQLIREKKKERQKQKHEADPDEGKYTMEELEKLQQQIKEAEQEKQLEEKKLKSQIQ